MIRGIEEEFRSHKYAHVERERRFLVDPSRCPELSSAPAILIEDRYVIGSRIRLRRMTDLTTGRTVMKMSKKYDVANVRARPIVTAYLDDAEYALFASLPAHPLEKRRHKVSDDGFGIDVFGGRLRGLLLAEIERADDASLDAVSPPRWVNSEVTDDSRYQGGHLAGLKLSQAAILLRSFRDRR